MDFRALPKFLILADTLNFTKAAARLHVSPAVLTRSIQRLESDLGVILVDRSTPLNLTAAGREFLPKAEKLVRDADRLKEETILSGQPLRLRLNIGFLSGILHLSLTGALAGFRKKHSNVGIRLHELNVRDQISGLLRGDLDVIIVGQPWPDLDREVDLFDLGSVPLCAVLSNSHPLAGKVFGLHDLREEEFVGLCAELWPGQTAQMETACREAGFEPKFTATAQGVGALLIMAGASHRVGLLSATANQIPHTGASFHPLPYRVPCSAAVRPKENRSVVREFLRDLRQEFERVAQSFGFSSSPLAHDHQKNTAAVNGS